MQARTRTQVLDGQHNQASTENMPVQNTQNNNKQTRCLNMLAGPPALCARTQLYRHGYALAGKRTHKKLRECSMLLRSSVGPSRSIRAGTISVPALKQYGQTCGRG